MENKKCLSKYDKDKIAEKCFLYDKYYGQLLKYLRFNKYDLEEITISFEKANTVYKRKLGQINAMLFILDLMYSSNEFYSMNNRELFGWCITLIGDRLKLYLENTFKDLTKE